MIPISVRSVACLSTPRSRAGPSLLWTETRRLAAAKGEAWPTQRVQPPMARARRRVGDGKVNPCEDLRALQHRCLKGRSDHRSAKRCHNHRLRPSARRAAASIGCNQHLSSSSPLHQPTYLAAIQAPSKMHAICNMTLKFHDSPPCHAKTLLEKTQGALGKTQ